MKQMAMKDFADAMAVVGQAALKEEKRLWGLFFLKVAKRGQETKAGEPRRVDPKTGEAKP